MDREPGCRAQCPGFSLQQHLSWALVAHGRSSHSSIWGGRDKEIRSSRSSLATWEVQDSVGLHEIISEGKGGLARGPLSCWTYTPYRNYSASLCGLRRWVWYPGTEQWCQAEMQPLTRGRGHPVGAVGQGRAERECGNWQRVGGFPRSMLLSLFGGCHPAGLF